MPPLRLTTPLLAAALASLATGALAEPREWSLDLGHAHLGWEIDHMNLARTVGRFDAFDGTFLIDEADPANSRIEITVDAASVNSNHVGRDNHVRSVDYLNAEDFPAITYRSTEIEMLTETGGKMHGELEMLGRTAPLTLDFELVADRAYPDFIPNYDEVRVVSFEATGELAASRPRHGVHRLPRLAHGALHRPRHPSGSRRLRGRLRHQRPLQLGPGRGVRRPRRELIARRRPPVAPPPGL